MCTSKFHTLVAKFLDVDLHTNFSITYATYTLKHLITNQDILSKSKLHDPFWCLVCERKCVFSLFFGPHILMVFCIIFSSFLDHQILTAKLETKVKILINIFVLLILNQMLHKAKVKFADKSILKNPRSGMFRYCPTLKFQYLDP